METAKRLKEAEDADQLAELLLAFESALDDRNRVLREISEALLAVLRPSRRRDSLLWRRKAEAQMAQLLRPAERAAPKEPSLLQEDPNPSAESPQFPTRLCLSAVTNNSYETTSRERKRDGFAARKHVWLRRVDLSLPNCESGRMSATLEERVSATFCCNHAAEFTIQLAG